MHLPNRSIQSWSSLEPCITSRVKSWGEQSIWSVQLCTVHVFAQCDTILSTKSVSCDEFQQTHDVLDDFGCTSKRGGKAFSRNSHISWILSDTFQTCMFSPFPQQHSLNASLLNQFSLKGSMNRKFTSGIFIRTVVILNKRREFPKHTM